MIKRVLFKNSVKEVAEQVRESSGAWDAVETWLKETAQNGRSDETDRALTDRLHALLDLAFAYPQEITEEDYFEEHA